MFAGNPANDLLIREELMEFLWLVMKGGLEKVVPSQHPASYAGDVRLCFLPEAEGRGDRIDANQVIPILQRNGGNLAGKKFVEVDKLVLLYFPQDTSH